MASPLEIPPWMPPERLVRVADPPAGRRRTDRCARCPVSSVPAKPRPDLEALHRRERQHRLGEVGLELVEHRLAQPGRHAARDRARRRRRASRRPSRAASMRSIMRSAAPPSGQRTMFASTASRVTVAASTVATMSAHPLDPGDDLDAGGRATRAAGARPRRPRRGRPSRARSRGRRPARRGCRTSPRRCSRRATGGTGPPSRRSPPARVLLRTSIAIGVPSVRPSSTPDRISTWSASRAGS